MPELHLGSAVSLAGPGPIYTLDGITPKIAPDAFIAPTAAVIGDVEIGAETGIWFHCLVRGDMNFIRIGARTNIQDGTDHPRRFRRVLHHHRRRRHRRPQRRHPRLHAEEPRLRRHLRHRAGRRGDRGRAACSAPAGLLTPGKVIGRNELWVGSPAKLLRVMTDEERKKFDRNAVVYRELAAQFRAGLRSTT